MSLTNEDGLQDEQGCCESFGPLADQKTENAAKNSDSSDSTEAPHIFTNNTNIRDLVNIKIIASARFIVKHCATASVRHSTIQPRLTTRISATECNATTR